jgi:hypothetical protein
MVGHSLFIPLPNSSVNAFPNYVWNRRFLTSLLIPAGSLATPSRSRVFKIECGRLAELSSEAGVAPMSQLTVARQVSPSYKVGNLMEPFCCPLGQKLNLMARHRFLVGNKQA